MSRRSPGVVGGGHVRSVSTPRSSAQRGCASTTSQRDAAVRRARSTKRIRPRASSMTPLFSRSRTTRFTVARVVAVIIASSSWLIRIHPSPSSTIPSSPRRSIWRWIRFVAGVNNSSTSCVVNRAIPFDQHRQQELVDDPPSRPVAEPCQVVTAQQPGVPRPHRDNRRAAVGVRRQQCQLTEDRPRLEHVDRQHVAERARTPGHEHASLDDVQRIARVALVEHHLVASELPPCRVPQQFRAVALGQQSGEGFHWHACLASARRAGVRSRRGRLVG